MVFPLRYLSGGAGTPNIKYVLYTVCQKKPYPQNEFTVTFEIFKIQLQNFAHLYFHLFWAYCEKIM